MCKSSQAGQNSECLEIQMGGGWVRVGVRVFGTVSVLTLSAWGDRPRPVREVRFMLFSSVSFSHGITTTCHFAELSKPGSLMYPDAKKSSLRTGNLPLTQLGDAQCCVT